MKYIAKTSNLTLEQVLLKELGLTPRSAVKKALQQNEILVNQKKKHRSALVQAGDEIQILSKNVFQKSQLTIKANDALPLNIVRFTNNVIVFSKQAGLHAHPLKPTDTETLLSGTTRLFPEVTIPMNPDKPLDGGLLHRLDQGTSGVLACARNQTTWKMVKEAWKNKNVEKVYLAWVHGLLQTEGCIELDIAHDPKSRKKMLATTPGQSRQKALPSKTSILPITHSILQNQESITLVLIRLHTGVTHQIRATLAALGHPILQDTLYAKHPILQKRNWKPLDQDSRKLFAQLKKEALRKTSPILNQLPPHGFYLHALWLRIPSVDTLNTGVLAPVPIYFG